MNKNISIQEFEQVLPDIWKYSLRVMKDRAEGKSGAIYHQDLPFSNKLIELIKEASNDE
jgi:hypothetical protein